MINDLIRIVLTLGYDFGNTSCVREKKTLSHSVKKVVPYSI